MHRGGDLHTRQIRGHELEQRHLGSGVLHRHPVGPVVGVLDAAVGAHRGRVVGVGEQHLLGEREWTAEAAARVSTARGYRA